MEDFVKRLRYLGLRIDFCDAIAPDEYCVYRGEELVCEGTFAEIEQCLAELEEKYAYVS